MGKQTSRKRKLFLTEDWRKRIAVGVIVGRLNKHINGKLELSPTQISAAKILLGKTIPDLTSTDLKADIKGTINWPLPKTKLDE